MALAGGVPGVVVALAGGLLAACSDADPLLFPPAAVLEVTVEPGLKGQAGERIPSPLEVRVTDRWGNPVPRTQVFLEVVEGGGRVDRATQESDDQGRVRVGSWTMGERPGTNRLRVSIRGVEAVVVGVEAGPGPPSVLERVGPDPQPVRVASVVPSLPVLRVSDRFGNPVPGVRVRFEASPGGQISVPEVVTDGAGRAPPPTWTLGPRAGPQALLARVDGVGFQNIPVEALPGPPTQAEWATPPGQRVEVGLFLPHPPEVRVTDAWGNGIPDIPVDFLVLGGGGVLEGVQERTDGSGAARVERWYLGPVPGENRLEARVQDFGALAPLTAVGVDASAEPQGRYFRVRAAHVNQSTQTLWGSIPLIPGRAGALRVFLEASEPGAPSPPVEIRVFHGATEVHRQVVAPPAGTVPTAVPADGWVPSWDLHLPGAWVRPGLAVEVHVDPDHEVGVVTRRWSRYPESGPPPSFPFVDPPTLRIRFIPLRHATDGRTGEITPGNLDAFMLETRRILPVGRDSVHIGDVYTTNLLGPDGNVRVVLGELRALWLATPHLQDHYFHGIFPGTLPTTFSGVAYVPATPANPNPIGMTWDRFPGAPFTLAHELGHNLGIRHAPCGNPSGVETDFPYPGATLGRTGYDILDRRLVHPAENRDLMSYCGPRWISDHNYVRMMTWRLNNVVGAPGWGGGPGDAVPPVGAVSSDAGATPAVPAPIPPSGLAAGLVLWGRITRDGVVVEPALPAVSRPHLPPAGVPGSYRLRGVDRDGVELFRLTFEPDRVSHGPDPDEAHFGFFVPLSSEDRGRLHRIEVDGPRGSSVQRGRVEELPGGLRAVAPRVQAPGAGGTPDPGTWPPDLFPLAVIRDASTGAILGMDRSGGIPPALRGREVDVTLLDGVRGWRLTPGGLMEVR